MPSENQSPSYLEEREYARWWLMNTKDGRAAADMLRRHAPGGDASRILDDDKVVAWGDLVRENQGLPMIAANCREARNAFDLARQASSNFNAAPFGKDVWRKFFTPPLGYFFRRQAEVADPDYWSDPKNVYREALAHPEWCCVSADHIRGKLNEYLPKGQLVA
mgnify:CR=1 FL=1